MGHHVLSKNSNNTIETFFSFAMLLRLKSQLTDLDVVSATYLHSEQVIKFFRLLKTSFWHLAGFSFELTKWSTTGSTAQVSNGVWFGARPSKVFSWSSKKDPIAARDSNEREKVAAFSFFTWKTFPAMKTSWIKHSQSGLHYKSTIVATSITSPT